MQFYMRTTRVTAPTAPKHKASLQLLPSVSLLPASVPGVICHCCPHPAILFISLLNASTQDPFPNKLLFDVTETLAPVLTVLCAHPG